MKKFSTLFLVFVNLLVFPLTISAEEVTFDFQNNNMNLPIGTSEDMNAGNLGGKSVTLSGVTLSFVNSMTMPTRYYLNGTRGNQFQAIAGGQMRVTAPAGFAVTKVTSVPNEGKNTSTGETTIQCSWAVTKGGGSLSSNKQVWTGNAESVLFSSTGATYLNAVVVELSTVTSETSLRANEPADSYTEVQGLAAYSAVKSDDLVKLVLTNAIVTSGMINGWGHYVQDATGGAHFYCTGMDLEVGDVLNGVVYVKKNVQKMGPRICMTEATNKEGLTITKNGSYEPIAGTIAQINVADNYCRVVRLAGVALKGTSETDATATDVTNTIVINNGKTNYYPYVIKESLATIDYADATIVGILFGTNSQGNKIMPLSITNNDPTAIQTIQQERPADGGIYYNLSGQRVEHPTKGLYIHNGRVVIK